MQTLLLISKFTVAVASRNSHDALAAVREENFTTMGQRGFGEGACLLGCLRLVREILALPPGRAPVITENAVVIACKSGNPLLVKFLLELRGGTFLDARKDDALRAACEWSRFRVVRLLLSLRADRAPSAEAQQECVQECAIACEPWTRDVDAWRACPVRRDMHALHPVLRGRILSRTKAALWRHRRVACAVRRCV